MKPRTLNDHESHYRYLQRWLIEKYSTLKLEELTELSLRKYPSAGSQTKEQAGIRGMMFPYERFQHLLTEPEKDEQDGQDERKNASWRLPDLPEA
ncbi:hypothetical protein ACFOQM_15040 [Paenibacillus sp. GCM10012307]|uniref:Uncharacterized protein n=1 Tax=Paenibacillus roseus TaxID=2798579 RepID=A0A934MVX4_9BACL|nr:hypothetical protein [Paenibacillus roseus]MBJ6362577.1 hypothetical protein [Paenibacillus roseus]